jgi:gamma-butyrobetaine dioxygenase
MDPERPDLELVIGGRPARFPAELLAQPGRQLNLRLAPGDCLVFDNTRVLHARTAFSMNPGSPERHLQGCYADLDGLASTLAVLKREENR